MGDDSNGAAQQLRRLAERATQQSSRTGEGPFAYVHTRGVRLSASYRITDREKPLRKLDEQSKRWEREFWLAGDGAGRIEETYAGQRTDISGAFGPRKAASHCAGV